MTKKKDSETEYDVPDHGPVAPPHPDHGLPDVDAPDQGLPGGRPGRPGQGLPDPIEPDQGLPGKPGKPGSPAHPDQGLPERRARVDNTLPDYERPVLIEGIDGGPAVEGPIVVQWHERKFTHDGHHYEHVSEEGEYWVYREM